MIAEELIDWNEAEELYEMREVYSTLGLSGVAKIEKSIRNQGFRDVTRDHEDYETILRHEDRPIEFKHHDREERLEIDMDGTKLSTTKELEMRYSLLIGHTDYADSLGKLLEEEKNPEMVRLYEA